jgi:uncharacterized membrane protein (DUF485 family)
MSLIVGDSRGTPRAGEPPVDMLIDAVASADLPRLPRVDGTTAGDALRELSARRNRLAITLTAIMMAAYFGFILLVAFDKPLVGSLLAGGRVSVGILLGASAILLAPVLTAIYVRWANRHYDHALEALRGRR